MKSTQWFERKLQISFISAQTNTVLNKLTVAGLQMYDVVCCDALTVRLWIPARDIGKLETVMQHCGCSYRVIAKQGFLWYPSALFRRPFLALGLLLYILMALWIPGKILFVTVEGNQNIPDNYILESAKNSGITFGSSRRAVRSEQTKNKLLSQIPQLQWVGINTSGCVVNISVREGDIQQNYSEDRLVSAIVASCDGVIQSIDVLRGTAMCAVGQTVKRGDVLISGYTDNGLKVTAEAAMGEVFAYTNRDLQIIAPHPTRCKTSVVSKHTNYRLRVGKKVINLCNDSGISGISCDKMYLEEYWSLPGGFRLPVSLIREICIVYADTADSTSDLARHEAWLSEFPEKYLSGQMVAGSILSQKIFCCTEDGYDTLSGEYACLEMIGKVKCEETLQKNAEDN